MVKRVTLKFHGDLDQGFQVFLEIRTASDQLIADEDGTLPAATHLDLQYEQWRNSYTGLLERSRVIRPSSITVNGTLIDQRERCAAQVTRLISDFNEWLSSPGFVPIEKRLIANVQRTENIQILIRTDDRRLHYLPWHEWAFLDRYPQAEVGMAQKVLAPVGVTVPAQDSPSTINILAVFGSSEGLDLSRDKAALNQLPNANIEFLENCSREDFIHTLEEKNWTILFFAGHGKKTKRQRTDSEIGWIYLNDEERISLEELKPSLRRSIERGLQVAIFNSCEGMGLAYDLAALNMPSVVIMREQIPDLAAQYFLSSFLKHFSEKSPLFLAVRRAREQIHQLMNHQFPGVSGLPIVWQNPAVKQMEWPIPPLEMKWWWPLLTSVGATALVLGLRYLGVLQPLELKAYDYLMRLRPGQDIRDERILIVAVEEEDIQYQREQGMEMEGSLSDEALLKLLQKISPHKPSVIGLDIFHDFPFSAELEPYLKNQNQFTAICLIKNSPGNLAGIKPPTNTYFSFEQFSFANFPSDPDQVIRRQYLQKEPDTICPTQQSFSFQIAKLFLSKTEGISVNWTASEGESSRIIKLGKQKFMRLKRNSGNYRLPVNPLPGYQILVDYRSVHPESINLRDILSSSIDSQLSELIANRIILIGVVNQAIDTHKTPYQTGQQAGRVPGIFVHSHMISQIIDAALGRRALLSWWPEWLNILWLGTSGIFASVLPIGWRSSVSVFILLLGKIALLWIVSFVLFTHGLWTPLIASTCSLAIATLLIFITYHFLTFWCHFRDQA